MMMDALDGRQARRTKSGSPVGQLFDHGCDSILAGIPLVLMGNSLGTGLTYLREMTMAVQILFFIGMW
jgi:ethanolaminephosphotransferase